MTLYEIKENLLAAMDAVTIDEETGEIVGTDAVSEIEAEFDEKAEAVACYIKQEEAIADAIKAEKKKLDERGKAHEKRAAWLKEYLASMMAEAKKTGLETAQVKISFRTSQVVVVDDPTIIPAQYQRTKVEADKTALKSALKNGEVIEGARLESRENLQIK